MLNIILLDNHDSFSYNLAAMFNNYKNVKITIRTPEHTNIEKISEFDKIIFSPGPGTPDEIPLMRAILERYHKTHGILGVCLGFQAIALYFGARIYKMNEVQHGRKKTLHITEPASKIYKNIPQNSHIGLYHSWAVSKDKIPDCIKITGLCEDKTIMSIEHKTYPIFGLQYHPESFITNYGKDIIDNWIKAG